VKQVMSFIPMRGGKEEKIQSMQICMGERERE
jgi:hypothetical protein